jgi:hypothetical protein
MSLCISLSQFAFVCHLKIMFVCLSSYRSLLLAILISLSGLYLCSTLRWRIFCQSLSSLAYREGDKKKRTTSKRRTEEGDPGHPPHTPYLSGQVRELPRKAPLSPSSTHLQLLQISRGCVGSSWQPPGGGQEWKNWYRTVKVSIFSFYGFLIGCLEAEI